MSKKRYSAEEVLRCLDEDSDSQFSGGHSNSDNDGDDSEIDVLSLHPIDNPSYSIRQVHDTSSPSPSNDDERNFHNMKNVPSSTFRQHIVDDISTTTSSSSEHPSSPIFSVHPSVSRKRKLNMFTPRALRRKLADSSSSSCTFSSTSCESELIAPSFTQPSTHMKTKRKKSTSVTAKRSFGDFSSHRTIDSALGESVLIPPSFTIDVNSSPPDGQSPLATSTPVTQESSGESLEDIMDAYNEYTSTLSTNSPSLSSSSITHISETELHNESDSSNSYSSNTHIKWDNVTTRKKKTTSVNTSKNVLNITHVSESSSSEFFPEDLSSLSSSTHSDRHLPKLQYHAAKSTINTDSSSDSSDFTQESVTRYRPNFTLAKIPFQQLCYFIKRYLKSVEHTPDRPEWPVHGMDKNQKRHFRRKVEDYKLQNNVLYHLHTYTEVINGETIKRCTFLFFYDFWFFL